MHEPEIVSPETSSSIESNDEAHEEAEAVPNKRSHGGCRNTKRYGDKLLAMEAHNISNFLVKTRCFCGNKCLEKLYHKGAEGRQAVYNLREQRFQSASP